MKQMTTLRQVRVASSCEADWNLMRGDDRVRHCSQCDLNVFNLSSMSTDEAEALILAKEGRLCVRYYQRKDGTVITGDCPVGRSALVRRFMAFASAGVMTLVGGLSWAATLGRADEIEAVKGRILETQPIRTVIDLISPPSAIAGDMAVCPPPAPPSKP